MLVVQVSELAHESQKVAAALQATKAKLESYVQLQYIQYNVCLLIFTSYSTRGLLLLLCVCLWMFLGVKSHF